MADKKFDRTVINIRERPLGTDINAAQTELDLATRELYADICARRVGDGDDRSRPMVPVGGAAFIGSGFKVRAASPASASVTVDIGTGFYNDGATASAIGGVTGLDDPSNFKPLSLTAQQTITSTPADPVNPRIDIVEVIFDRRLVDPANRDVLDTVTGKFVPNTVNKTLTYNQDGRTSVNGTASINYKVGTPAGVPVAPPVSPGYVKIAEIDRPPPGASLINQNQIRDLRPLLFVNNQALFTAFYSHLTDAINRVNCPPGCLMTVTVGPGNLINFFMFAGGAFNTAMPLGISPLVNSTLASPLFFNDFGNFQVDTPAGLNPIVEPGPVSVVVTPAAFAAASPSLQVAPGQPFSYASVGIGPGDPFPANLGLNIAFAMFRSV